MYHAKARRREDRGERTEDRGQRTEDGGRRTEIIFSQRRKWDTKPRLLASVEKAENLVKYKPVVNFEEGFQANIEWFKDNWQKIEVVSDFPPGMSSAVRGIARGGRRL